MKEGKLGGGVKNLMELTNISDLIENTKKDSR